MAIKFKLPDFLSFEIFLRYFDLFRNKLIVEKSGQMALLVERLAISDAISNREGVSSFRFDLSKGASRAFVRECGNPK